MCQSKADGGRRCKPSKGLRSSTAATKTSGSAPQELSAQMRRTRRVVLRDTIAQLEALLNALVDAAPVNSPATLVSANAVGTLGQRGDGPGYIPPRAQNGNPRPTLQLTRTGSGAALSRSVKERYLLRGRKLIVSYYQVPAFTLGGLKVNIASSG